jgi:surface carbohydrate biosynthesis protein
VKKISIIVDNPQRDLAGYTYLSEELVKNNFLVFLTPMYNFHEVFLINPDLVILNHARKEKLHSSGVDLIIKYCSLSNIKIVIIDSEGGLFKNSFVNKYKKFINESGSKIDKYFLWGSNKISLVNKKNLDKYVVAGNPRLDLFFLKNYNNKFLKEFDKKNYILVNTSFPKLNPLEGDKIILKELNKFKKSRLYYNQKLYFEKFLKFLKSFSKLNQNINFILRPHPFESIQTYRREFANYNNIEIINKGDIFFYLKKCRFVINHNCQTSLDAILANKNCINFSNYELTQELSILDKISTRVDNEDQLKSVINKFLINNKVNKLIRKRLLVAKYYNNVNQLSSLQIIKHIKLLFNKTVHNHAFNFSIFRIIKIYLKNRTFLGVIKFILKLFLGTKFFFTIRSFFGNQMYKRKNFELSDVLDLIRFSEKDKLIIKRSSILDLHYKSLLFPQSILIKKN